MATTNNEVSTRMEAGRSNHINTLGLVLEEQGAGVIETASDIAHIENAGLFKSASATKSGEVPGVEGNVTIDALRERTV